MIPQNINLKLVVLHTVRLAGFASSTTLAERAELPVEIVEETIHLLESQKLIEKFRFANTSGWILNEAGKQHDAKLLQRELGASGIRPVLEQASQDFESINPRLVQTVTAWQLRSSADTSDQSNKILRELTDLAQELEVLMVDLVIQVPRFGRYIRQFSAALDKARAGEHQWIASAGVLSCHLVWAELHEDLLSSLGYDRAAQISKEDY